MKMGRSICVLCQRDAAGPSHWRCSVCEVLLHNEKDIPTYIRAGGVFPCHCGALHPDTRPDRFDPTRCVDCADLHRDHKPVLDPEPGPSKSRLSQAAMARIRLAKKATPPRHATESRERRQTTNRVRDVRRSRRDLRQTDIELAVLWLDQRGLDVTLRRCQLLLERDCAAVLRLFETRDPETRWLAV